MPYTCAIMLDGRGLWNSVTAKSEYRLKPSFGSDGSGAVGVCVLSLIHI